MKIIKHGITESCNEKMHPEIESEMEIPLDSIMEVMIWQTGRR